MAGRNVREVREKLALSQDAFAHLCGIHRTYVGAIERGECNITLDTLARIADAAGIKPQSLLEQDFVSGALRRKGPRGGRLE